MSLFVNHILRAVEKRGVSKTEITTRPDRNDHVAGILPKCEYSPVRIRLAILLLTLSRVARGLVCVFARVARSVKSPVWDPDS